MFILDSSQFTIKLPEVKIKTIIKLTTSMLSNKTRGIFNLFKLIGTLVAAYPASEYGRVHIKSLERVKIEMLRDHGNNFGLS